MDKSIKEQFEADDSLELIDDQDYAIVISPDGKLKSVYFPLIEDQLEHPKSIQKIMKIFGITNLEDLSANRTLH